MADAKGEFRHNVWAQKQNAFFDSDLAKKITLGMKRAEKYKDNWESVNINTFVDKFTPNPIIAVDKGKLTFLSRDGKMAIIADLGGSYCRLADLSGSKICYLDINGNNPNNYKDSYGKQHGRNRSERQKVTHFRIQKWAEMAKYLPMVLN